jgi:hypothetical protein
MRFARPVAERFRGRVVLRPERPMGRRDVDRMVAAFFAPRLGQNDSLRL